MSAVWSWFVGGSAAKKDTPKAAIIGLRSQLDMLHKRAEHLMVQIAKEAAKAKANVNTNREGESRLVNVT